jgi:hypothetical protein
LANPLQSSSSTFSWGSFLSFFAFKEDMLGTPISVRGGWPTVSLPFLTHVQGVRLNHAIFASEEVIFFSIGSEDRQKCPCKDSNITVIMLAAPYRVSGDHPSLTLFAKILLQLVSPPLHMGWDTALFAGKYPMFT